MKTTFIWVLNSKIYYSREDRVLSDIFRRKNGNDYAYCLGCITINRRGQTIYESTSQNNTKPQMRIRVFIQEKSTSTKLFNPWSYLRILLLLLYKAHRFC